MSISLIIIGSIILGIVQIQIFKGLPNSIRNFLANIPLLGIILNFMLSQMILHFVGAAYGLGICNMVGSVIFGIWVYRFKKRLYVSKRIMGFPLFKEKSKKHQYGKYM